MINYIMPDTLSFEEFHKLADREPNISGKWIYKLTQAFIYEKSEKTYPSFKFDWIEDFYFLSYEEALQNIQNFKDKNLYCSWLTQLPTGIINTFPGNEGAKWLFNKDGHLIDYTGIIEYGEGIDSCFFGRSEARLRFKGGDIAEYISLNGVSLVLILNEVPSIKDCWKAYNLKKRYFRAYTWDSYNTLEFLENPIKTDISPIALMKPRFKIPDEIIKEMKILAQKVTEQTKPEDPDNYIRLYREAK